MNIGEWREITKIAAGKKIVGIPSFGRQKRIPSIKLQKKEPVIWDFSLQRHKATTDHHDLRLSNGKTAFSWAVPEGLPERPGSSRLAIRQSDHSHGYMDFEGTIPSGYGAGTVTLAKRGKVQIMESTDSKVKFVDLTGRKPEYYLMNKKKGELGEKGEWWITNVTSRSSGKEVGYKPKYKSLTPDKLKLDDSAFIMTDKVDGAHTLTTFKPNKPTLYSYRRSKREKSGLIDHSVLAQILDKRIPKDLNKVTVRHETYIVDKKGKPIPIQQLSPLMNMRIGKALEIMREKKLRSRQMVFDVVKGPKGKDMTNASFAEKLKIMKRVVSVMKDKGYHLPDMAKTPKEKRSLLAKIKSRRHGRTEEGVVMWPIKGGTPVKVKYTNVYDVYPREIFQGTGAMSRVAGGFTYSITPKGRIVGKCGTGFSLAQRKEMQEHPGKWIGHKVVVNAQSQYPSGALRAPAFSHHHL